MRAIIYEILGLALLVGSGFLFFRSIEFLAQKDYLSGILVLVVGVTVIRTGVELGKLAVLARRERQ